MKHSKLYENAEEQLKSLKQEMLDKDATFTEMKSQLKNALEDSEKRLGEVNKQNKILHDQISAMGEKVDAIQFNKVSQEAVRESVNDTADVVVLTKELKDLREVVSYMRSEREISETQLQSARLAAERERASSDIMKKSLEEARSELETLQKNINNDCELRDERGNWQARLKDSEEQLTLLRESNKLLRNESEKLNEKLTILQVETDNAKNAMKPSDKKCRDLEVEKAALLAEKSSLIREIDVWKDRVSSLVSQFHQVRIERCLSLDKNL